MVWGEVEGLEVVVVGLGLRTSAGLEAQAAEDLSYLGHGLTDWVAGPQKPPPAGEGDIQGGRAGSGGAEALLPLGDGLFQLSLGLIDRLAKGGPLLCWQGADALQQPGQLSLAAQVADADLIKRLEISRLRGGRQGALKHLGQVGLHRSGFEPQAARASLASLARWLKAWGSVTARSARILRSTSIPAALSPVMRRE